MVWSSYQKPHPGPGEEMIGHTWGEQCGLGQESHPWHFYLWKFQQVHCLSWPGKVRRPGAPAWWRQPQGGKRMPSYQITMLTSCHSSALGAVALLSLPQYPENFLPQGICTCYSSASNTLISHTYESWFLSTFRFKLKIRLSQNTTPGHQVWDSCIQSLSLTPTPLQSVSLMIPAWISSQSSLQNATTLFAYFTYSLHIYWTLTVCDLFVGTQNSK